MKPAPKSPRSKTFPYATRFAPTRHGTLAYFDEGSGPAVIFVHGLAGDFAHFEFIAPSIVERCRMIGVDMLGCGQSDAAAERHTVALYAETVLDLLDHLGLERAMLVGHSAGGMVCAQVALRAPRRIERLGLINSAGYRSYAPWMHVGRQLVIRPAVLNLALAKAAPHILGLVFHQRNDYTAKFTHDSIDRPPGTIIAEMAPVMCDLMPDLMSPFLAENAPRLTLPVLALWGDHDRLAPLATVRAVVARFPRGRLEVIPDCGHLPMVEQPRRTRELLSQFLSEPKATQLTL